MNEQRTSHRTADRDDREWLRDQVARYRHAFPRYRSYARFLSECLGRAAAEIAPLAIVQTRPKAVASFADKALRKRGQYADPVSQFTDLCGGRVIVRTRSEVASFSEFVKARFLVDWENSVDHVHRLQPTEFGYRSAHYIVAIDSRDQAVRVPPNIRGLKAEVQVRTMAEHAWADFAHDLSYKGAFALPRQWQREIAILSAKLEDVDVGFARIEDSLRRYAATYGTFLGEERASEEMRTLRAILEHDPANARLAWRIGHLAISRGDWATAVEVLAPFVDPAHPEGADPAVLRDLGVALCKVHRASPTGRPYRLGQRYLELAGAAPRRDADAVASLAGTWRGIDDARARSLYLQAFELDPTDIYPLSNVLEDWARTDGESSLPLLRPLLGPAIGRCIDQAAVGVNVPWVYYGLGKLWLLKAEPGESLRAYAKAIHTSTATFMIQGSLDSLERLAPLGDRLGGYDHARLLLALGLLARFPSLEAADRLRDLLPAQTRARRLEGGQPVVIVAGSTREGAIGDQQAWREVLVEGFRDFAGTILSGGTTAGVSGLVGEVRTSSPDRIRAIGYVPRTVSPATEDRRYSELRRTEGDGFTVLEPLRAWSDILLSEIRPAQVTVVGVGGGEISAIEYRLALAFGARLCLVRGSGGEAARMLADADWQGADGLVGIPADGATLRAVIGSAGLALPEELREAVARGVHERYRDARAVDRADADPAMRDWEQLREDLKESNRLQADHAIAKLREIGCGVRPASERPSPLMTFTDNEVETMARMEHGRWNAERLLQGWVLGERRDVDAKVTPYLVPWSELSEEVREFDREAVRRIPEFLAEVGLEVYR